MQLRYDGEYLHLEEHGLVPIAFYLEAQVALFVLLHIFHPTRVVAKSAQIGVEPSGQIVAFATHKLFFFLGEAQVLKILYLAFELIGKSCRIFGAVAVYKLIFHHGAWEAIEYGAAHSELIEVGIGEMGDDWFHSFSVSSFF